MKRSEIYLKAAAIIEKGEERYGCHAMEKVKYGSGWEMMPDTTPDDAPEAFMFRRVEKWETFYSWNTFAKDFTVMVLLFAHEIAKSNGN